MRRFVITQCMPDGTEYVEIEKSVASFHEATCLLIENLQQTAEPEFGQEILREWQKEYEPFFYICVEGKDEFVTHRFEYFPD